MRTSDSGKLFIKSFEQFRPTMYLDQAGKPTIGYGHLIEQDDPNHYMVKTITIQEGNQLFDFDLYNKAEQFLNYSVTATLTQYEYDALASLVFNIGGGNFVTSSLLRKLNRNFGKYDIAEEFLKWNKVRIKGELVPSAGLTKRRQAERKMFLGLEVDITNPST